MQRQDLNFLLRISLIAILTGLFAFESFAQTKLVAGVVKDQSGEPLIGVNVMEKGTTNGSITDVDGKYSVSVTGKNPVLVFSYIGYVSQEIPVAGKNKIERRHGRAGRSRRDRLRHGQEEGLDGSDLPRKS